MKPCCGEPEPEKDQEAVSSCCEPKKRQIDWLLWGSLIVSAVGYVIQLSNVTPLPQVAVFSHAIFELFNQMWWGLLIGIFVVGLLAKIPRQFVMSVLGRDGGLRGILRATAAGLLLDLCNHGILLVAMQLYRRGASLGQLMAFLIASPWNSLSLTIILASLIGVPWTLAFIALSGLIAIVSGLIFEALVRAEKLPANPNHIEVDADFQFWRETRAGIARTKFGGAFWHDVLKNGFGESRMILRWIFFGLVLAGVFRVLMPDTAMETWFGPTLAGLGLTLAIATILEVCSEGSSPIAADLLTRAQAPGNSFTFLMSGAATDYTEIMALRETTGSWRTALALPAITVPQILVLGWVLNHF